MEGCAAPHNRAGRPDPYPVIRVALTVISSAALGTGTKFNTRPQKTRPGKCLSPSGDPDSAGDRHAPLAETARRQQRWCQSPSN